MPTYIPGLLQIRPQYSIAGADDTPENVTWWLGATADIELTAAQLTAIQTVFDGAWSDFITAMGSTQDFYTGSIVTDWSTSLGLTVDNTGYTPVAGSATGSSAAQVAALLSLKEQDRYRGGHGRVYLPGLASNYLQTGNSLTSGLVTSLESVVSALKGAMLGIPSSNGGGYSQRIFHQKRQVVPHTTPPTYMTPYLSAISGTVVNTIVATQRRRIRKVSHR